MNKKYTIPAILLVSLVMCSLVMAAFVQSSIIGSGGTISIPSVNQSKVVTTFQSFTYNQMTVVEAGKPNVTTAGGKLLVNQRDKQGVIIDVLSIDYKMLTKKTVGNVTTINAQATACSLQNLGKIKYCPTETLVIKVNSGTKLITITGTGDVPFVSKNIVLK